MTEHRVATPEEIGAELHAAHALILCLGKSIDDRLRNTVDPKVRGPYFLRQLRREITTYLERSDDHL